MHTLVLEFDDAHALEDALQHLWDRLGITGEVLVQRVSEACWRLELVAEQTVRSSTLEKIGGRVVKS
jgi:hypothetical protein